MKICRRRFLLGASATGLTAFGGPAKAVLLSGTPLPSQQSNSSKFTFTPPLTAYLTAPSLGISDAQLSGMAVGGYKVTSNGDGSQVYFEYKIGTELDNLTLANSGANDGMSIGNLDAHTIAIRDANSNLVGYFNLPSKQARTHWRFPWVTDKVLLSPSDLVTNRYMFAYGNPGGARPLFAGSLAPATYNDPNSFAGMMRTQGSTGERPEIGLQTEWAAYFMATGDANAMIQVAEAAGTAPCFFEDPDTGQPFNKLTYPSANNYGSGPQYHGRPWVPATNSGGPIDVYLATNHFPEISYLAALTTKNPWHLRNLQFWANNFLVGDGWVSSDGLNAPFLPADEQRLLAWGLRTFGMAHVATKYFEDLGTLPANCLPSSYFETILLNTLKYILQPMSVDPDLQVTRIFWKDGSGAFAPWQQGYIGEALAFLVLTGHTEFNAVYLWHLQGIIDLTSGKTGWPMQFPSPYWLYCGAGTAAGALPSWAAIWSAYAVAGPPGGQLGNLLTQAQLNSYTRNPAAIVLLDNSQGDYFQESRQCLAAATYMHNLGILDILTTCPDLTISYNNLNMMMVNLDKAQTNPYHRWLFSWRNAVVIDASVAPKTITQAKQVPA